MSLLKSRSDLFLPFAIFAVIVFIITSYPAGAPDVEAQLASSAEMVPAGSCDGTCAPAASCGTGETLENNCECRGTAANCGCKGTYKCYNSLGVKVGGGKCAGDCKYSKTAFEPYEELMAPEQK